ncbi:MAG: serine hydrolase, partial [Cytophagales bacterium]
NAAFTTAGEVIPAVTQTSWQDFIRTNILQPLKMTNTKMLASELTNARNLAQPYTVVDGKLTAITVAQIDNLAPAGTISSSAKDMVNWVTAQIDMGKFEGNQVIPHEAIAATRVPHSIMGMDPRDKRDTHFYLYGLGMDIRDRAGKIVVSHTGGVDGFLSSVMIVPEEKLGIVILTNTDQNNFFQDLTNEIRDAYLNLPYRGYTYQSLKNNREQKLEEKKQLDSLKNLINPKNRPALPLASYAGSYTNELYGDISIVLEKGSLVIRFSHHPQLTGKLDALKDNTFLCTYSSPTYGIKTFPFYVKDGKVTGFTLTVNDFVEFTPYEFVKK